MRSIADATGRSQVTRWVKTRVVGLAFLTSTGLALTAGSSLGQVGWHLPPTAREPEMDPIDPSDSNWIPLFDGVSEAHFRQFKGPGFPKQGWVVEEGSLKHIEGGGGGDLVTVDEYRNFDLRLEWRISQGGNSGILYRVSEDGPHSWSTGPEMQILDDEGHPDGQVPVTSAGSLYGLIAPTNKVVHPAGTWNTARIVVDGNHIEHWLNGVLVVAYDLQSPAWRDLVAHSKFATMPGYGLRPSGRIALQDHWNAVWYRHIWIRRLP
jgi:hypothetical protein